MDEYTSVATQEQLEARSGEDRRMPRDRRRGKHRLLELHARRDGEETDRRQRERRRKEGTSWFSFLWRWAKN
jgi:hypothetical protein